jgi:hypothetical protein
MPDAQQAFGEGGCDCRKVRYRLLEAPYVVHCCHCSWCQRESGSAFALNAVIEADRVELLGEPPQRIDTPSASGKGQAIFRCPHCNVAVWSHYAGVGPRANFIRVGTLDDPATCSPDVHIFTADKQPWVVIPEGAEQFTMFYSGKDVVRIYGVDGAARWKALRGS